MLKREKIILNNGEERDKQVNNYIKKWLLSPAGGVHIAGGESKLAPGSLP